MNYNSHDGEQKAQAEAPKDEGSCDCFVCDFRELLERRYPGSPTNDQKNEVRADLARIAGMLLSDASQEQVDEFVSKMNRTRDASMRRRKFEDGLEEAIKRMFGDGIKIIRI